MGNDWKRAATGIAKSIALAGCETCLWGRTPMQNSSLEWVETCEDNPFGSDERKCVEHILRCNGVAR